MECIFCKIVRGESIAEVLYENEHAISILDINPIHFGHALVFPKQHSETFLSVPEEELPDVMKATHIVSKAIVNAFQPEGFNIFSNNGRAAGQSVFHFHLHITPRYVEDDIKFILKLKQYGRGEMNDYANRLRQHIKPNSTHNH
ncbi:MAG: HIT family protein [Bacteroidetes bacterium]|nr:MAG: HIT family protein [Bacteroidota bacterium]